MFKISDTIKTAKFSLATVLLLLASCSSSSDKQEYDLGPRRSPQDNQSVMRGASRTQEQAPAPLIPGYNIPAPRMIDSPGYPQGGSSIDNTMALENAPLAEGRRRPSKQFNGRLPGLSAPAPVQDTMMVAPVLPYQSVGAAPSPAGVSDPMQTQDTSFMERVKGLFRKKEQPEPKRAPGGQGHLAGGYSGVDSRGFSVDAGTHLDSELQSMPKTKAERAAVSGEQESVPTGKTLHAAPAKKEVVKPKPVVTKARKAPTAASKTKKPERWENPDKAPVAPEVKKVAPAPLAPPIMPPVPNVTDEKTFHEQVEERWKEQQETPPPAPGGAPALEGQKLEEKDLEAIPEEEAPLSQAEPSSGGASADAEVLMEFDINENGELVDIPSIAPTAGVMKTSDYPKTRH